MSLCLPGNGGGNSILRITLLLHRGGWTSCGSVPLGLRSWGWAALWGGEPPSRDGCCHRSAERVTGTGNKSAICNNGHHDKHLFRVLGTASQQGSSVTGIVAKLKLKLPRRRPRRNPPRRGRLSLQSAEKLLQLMCAALWKILLSGCLPCSWLIQDFGVPSPLIFTSTSAYWKIFLKTTEKNYKRW